jgi:C-terminal processing protease CtpA/Prc
LIIISFNPACLHSHLFLDIAVEEQDDHEDVGEEVTDSGAAMAIFSLVTGDYSYLRTMYSDSGEQMYFKYMIDTNLDGKFDEKDLQKQYNFKFGIITTTAAYSCGNLVPVILKEKGVIIIGEKTGGGAHTMEAGALPDGFFFHLSSTSTMADSTWKTVETGAEPDYVLVDSFSDNPDYSVLYDIDKISELMNKSNSSDDNTMIYIIVGVIAAIVIVGALVIVLRRNH